VATIGTTEVDGTEPMAVGSHQRIGSITKTFTATLLLQLAEDGALSLDDPIGDHVPGTPNPQATLGQLAAMRSGIPSYTFAPEFAEALFGDPSRSWQPEELVALVEGADPLFAPGEAWNYSNTNIVLLGMVIEQVSGQPVEELVAERIATPLGLTSTAMPTGAALPDPHARGLTVQGQDGRVPVDATDWNPSWGWTAGGMIATVEDLLTYGRELVVGGTLLSEEMQEERIASMQTQGPQFPPDHTYGYGLQEANGWWGHTGELPGFNSFMYHHRDQDLTVVVLVNSDIKSGACTGDDAALTTPGGRTTGPCLDPAVHLADLVTAALGYPGNPGDLGGATPGTAG
jgi:D-alanyl-D-alanine carboxypeptidase